MSDPRVTPDPARVVEHTPYRIILGTADITRDPGWPRDRQLLFGETVTQLSEQNGWAYVQSDRDGYVGHLPASALGETRKATHRVTSLGTAIYRGPDLKTVDIQDLHHGSLVTVTGAAGRYAETPDGFVPRAHLTPLSDPPTDPAAVATLYLGTPYLWGGNSRLGIDCSGLVQAALLTCGTPCPGDSDMQEKAFDHIDPATRRRGDLVFWNGHVGILLDEKTLIHANAHHMTVAVEPLDRAIARIGQREFGAVTAYARP